MMNWLIVFAIQDGSPEALLNRLLDGKPATAQELKSLPSTPLGRAVAVIGIQLRQKAWVLEKEDVDIVRRCVSSNGGKNKSFPFLASEITRVRKDGLKLPMARTLALAFLEEMQASGASIPDLEAKSKSLGIVKDKEGGWVTPEGPIVARVRSQEFSVEDLEKIIPPATPGAEGSMGYFQAAQILMAAFKAQGAALAEGLSRAARAFRSVPAQNVTLKKYSDDLKTILERYKFCKNCGGSQSRPCDYGPCEAGKITKCCAMCNGTGKNPQSYHAPNFQTPCPGPGNGGKHKWVDNCTRCQGTAKTPCKACKAPWQSPAPEQVFERVPCEFCSGSGWALERVRLPCPDCCGVGSIVRPPKPAPVEAEKK
jgi:hypothetical protein